MTSIIDPEDINVISTISYRNRLRTMLSRKNVSSIEIISSLKPGEITEGCLVCCSAPSCCPLCSILPCCGDAEYVKIKWKESTYVHIRENSLEWNKPQVVMRNGPCCGIDPCEYDVQDKVTVLYFDDVVFEKITDQTRCCHECLTCLFGGKGESVRLESPICCSCCKRGTCPCLCVPVCCPLWLCPCQVQYEIHLEDAQKGVYEINKAVSAAKNSSLYGSSDKCNQLV